MNDLSENGWGVIGTSRSAPTPNLRAGATWIQHDIISEDITSLQRAVEAPALDAVVISAMLGGPKGGAAGLDPTSLLKSFNVAVGGALRVIQACLPALQRSEEPTIAIVSSRLGSISAQARGDYQNLDTSYAYRVSKAAQNMLLVSLAHEFGATMRCWAVHPGTLTSNMGRPGAEKTPEEAARQLREELESSNRDSPRFLSLGSADLDW